MICPYCNSTVVYYEHSFIAQELFHCHTCSNPNMDIILYKDITHDYIVSVFDFNLLTEGFIIFIHNNNNNNNSLLDDNTFLYKKLKNLYPGFPGLNGYSKEFICSLPKNNINPQNAHDKLITYLTYL